MSALSIVQAWVQGDLLPTAQNEALVPIIHHGLLNEAQHLNDLGLANAEKLGQMGPPLASVEAGQQEESQYRCRYVHIVRH